MPGNGGFAGIAGFFAGAAVLRRSLATPTIEGVPLRHRMRCRVEAMAASPALPVPLPVRPSDAAREAAIG
jgi:hypothetical protein